MTARKEVGMRGEGAPPRQRQPTRARARPPQAALPHQGTRLAKRLDSWENSHLGLRWRGTWPDFQVRAGEVRRAGAGASEPSRGGRGLQALPVVPSAGACLAPAPRWRPGTRCSGNPPLGASACLQHGSGPAFQDCACCALSLVGEVLRTWPIACSHPAETLPVVRTFLTARFCKGLPGASLKHGFIYT